MSNSKSILQDNLETKGYDMEDLAYDEFLFEASEAVIFSQGQETFILKQRNTTLTERVGKLTEALEFTVNQINKRIKYKPSNSAQGGIDARDKVCFNDAVQILKDNKEK